MRKLLLKTRTGRFVAAIDVPGGEIPAPLAAVQLGGLVVATVAALVVVPALSVIVNPKAKGA